MPDRSVAPAIRQIEQISIPKAQTITLGNGVLLHYVDAGKQPVLRLELIFKAGKLYEGHPGLSYFTGKLLPEGTQDQSAGEIASFFDRLGAHIEINPGFDQVVLTIHFLSRHLELILGMLRDIITKPAFSESELENLKRRKRQQLLVDLKKNSVLASRNFSSSIFGASHPYGRSLTPETIDEVSIDKVTGFYHQRIEGNFEVLVSGQVGKDDLTTIDSFLGDIPVNQETPLNINEIAYTALSSYQEIAGSLQSSIRVGMPMIDRRHADYPGLLIANEILGGYFGSRLMKNIREQKGYTYGIHATINSLSNRAFWVIGTDVRKEVHPQTLQEIEKEIEFLRKQLVPEQELETVRNYMMGTFIASLDTPFAIADKFKAIHFSGLGYEYFDNYLKTIREIDNHTIRELCRKYFRWERMTKVVVG